MDEQDRRTINCADSEVNVISTFIDVRAIDANIIIVIVRWVSSCMCTYAKWRRRAHHDVSFNVGNFASNLHQLAIKNWERFCVLNLEEAGPVSKMLPIIGHTRSGIHSTVFRQQLVWKNAISLYKLPLPPITSRVKRKVVVGHGLTDGRTFDTRGVIISFVNMHISCYREIWVSSAHGNVLWSIGSSAIYFI